MNTPKQPYWFPAKRYGCGWGIPATWQGWVVLIIWTILIIVVSPILALHSMPMFFVFMAIMGAALIAICLAKGEPPKWRWGKG